MINIAILITFLVIAFRASNALRKNSHIFYEYKLITSLPVLVFLYPVGPLLLLAGNLLHAFYLYPLAIFCYIPQLIIARRNSLILETAGTDRVDDAKSALTLTTLGALAGLLYLLAAMILSFSVYGLDFSNYGAS